MTSVVKNVDVAVLRAIGQALQGQLAYGKSESLGVAERGISLARGSEVLAQASPAVIQALEATQAAVARGELRVPSAFTPAP